MGKVLRKRLVEKNRGLSPIFLGAATNGTNTAVTNAVYGRNDSVLWSAGLGGVFGVAGNVAGIYAKSASVAYMPNITYTSGGTTRIAPLTLQGGLSPLPGYIGTGTSSFVGGIPTLFPGQMPQTGLK